MSKRILVRNRKWLEEHCTRKKDKYFSKIDGSYITHVGMENDIGYLQKRGITKPQGLRCAHLGWCESEQKWYGWSHRAIYGFGIGSEVKFGDCAYVPKDEDDLCNYFTNFWKDEYHENVRTNIKDGVCYTEWDYTKDVPNKSLRSNIGGCENQIPDDWGKGEWKANTIEEAFEMATDFADSVG